MRCPTCKIDMVLSSEQFKCPECQAIWRIMSKEDFSGYYDDDDDFGWDKSVEEAGDYAYFDTDND